MEKFKKWLENKCKEISQNNKQTEREIENRRVNIRKFKGQPRSSSSKYYEVQK